MSITFSTFDVGFTLISTKAPQASSTFFTNSADSFETLSKIIIFFLVSIIFLPSTPLTPVSLVYRTNTSLEYAPTSRIITS